MLNNSDLPPKQGKTTMQWIIAILVNTTLLTYGMQAGWISPMTRVLQSKTSLVVQQPISDASLTWIASIMPIMAVFGVPLYTYLADKYGRRIGVLAIAVPQAICWIIKMVTTSVPGLLIARICAGVAAGGCFCITPMYVKELSQDNIRGLLVSLMGLNQNLGFLFMYAMGAFLDYYTVLWIAVWLPLVLIALLIKIPESPAFLVKLGKYEAAASTVALLRGWKPDDKEVVHEIDSMKTEDTYFKTLPHISFISILKNKPWRKGLLMIMTVITCQAFNGSFAIVTYASTILVTSGVTISPDVQTLSIPAVMIVGSAISIVCVERMGRKVMLSSAFGITVVSLLCLASIMLVQHQGGSVPGWLPVFAIVAAVWAYAAGVAPIPYVVMAEMFNFQIRAKVLGCLVTYAWFISFVQLFAFTPISNALGTYTMFYCFAGTNLLGVVIALVLLPETKGKTVDEITLILFKSIVLYCLMQKKMGDKKSESCITSKNKDGHTYMQWLVAIIVNTALLNYGLQIAWISPMTKVLQSETSSVVAKPISDENWSWIASVVPMMAVLGVPFYTYLSDKYGRKVGVVAIAVPQALCWIIKLLTTTVPGLLTARICAGIAAGGCFTVIPMYIKELSQDNIRGLLVSLVGLNQNLGYIIMYAMGAYLEYYTVLWIVVWLPLVLILFLMKAPESPAFLVKIGKYEAAASTIAFLRGREPTDKEVVNEITYMRNEDMYFKSLPPITFLCIFKNKPWRKGIFLLILLGGIQACNGCFAIITYISSILGSSGVTISVELQSLSIPAFMILGSIVTILTVDRLGRKPLLVITYAITVASFLCLASIMLVQHQGGSVPGWLPVLAIVTAMWAYATGVTSVPGVIMAEMFNFQIRAKVVGLVTMSAWSVTFLGVFAYTPISNIVGMYATFYGFAGVNLLGFFVCLVLVPETKGKTVEEIELMLSGGDMIESKNEKRDSLI
ncbi:uncharacterized protein LOC113511257 [Galleria mellonella]|uniref:Uncharacterized protein LOC113511257 n=1 Tax=Galleria mellonella TaxID=7137 RepID=A0ABM3MA14_GALME|nr:uncharacterized protein LOC113511257 [Galleria mellonella]